MKILKLLLSVAMCSLLASASAVFAQAATVFELTGTATASAAVAPAAPAATVRALRKGDAINQGDTVRTGAGSSVVLSFLDGQIVALTANSTFAVNNYTYNRAEPAKSTVLLSLINGGMRAITGLIGQARPQAVAYRAGNATIGIRGTDLEIGVDEDDFFAIANSGEAEVELEADNVETALFSFPVSGNIAAMAATVEVPIQIAARSKQRINTSLGIIKTKGLFALRNSATIRLLVATMSARIQAAAQGLNDPAVKAAVERAIVVARRVIRNARVSEGEEKEVESALQAIRTAVTASQSSSGAGGGSTPCDSVSPVRSPAGCTPR